MTGTGVEEKDLQQGQEKERVVRRERVRAWVSRLKESGVGRRGPRSCMQKPGVGAEQGAAEPLAGTQH